MEQGNLVSDLKDGDEEAFVTLVDMFKNKIVALCRSYTEDIHEAEDLSQEVFISVFKSINNFRGESSLSTYIYKIAVSKCIDYKRKSRIKYFLTGLIHPEAGYEENIDEKSYIRDIINKLPQDLKTAIILYYYVGLQHKEIAEISGTTAKTIEGRIYRAKQKIKIQLEKEGYSDAARLG